MIGFMIAGFSDTFENISDALTAETFALQATLRWMIDHGIRNASVESDY